jgi:hypothetical protein
LEKQAEDSDIDSQPTVEPAQEPADDETKDKGKDASDSTEMEKISGPSQFIDVDKIEGNTEIAQTVKKYHLGMGTGGSYQMKKFSVSDTYPLPNNLFDIASKTYVYPEDKIESLKSTLTANRILILTGQTGCRKFITATYLAKCLIDESRKNYKILTVYALDKEIIVEFLEFIKKSDNLKKKILIFQDVFKKNNQNLKEFFNSYSKEQAEFVSSRVSQLNAYILFTADTDTFTPYVLSQFAIIHDISAIKGENLNQAFKKKIDYFCFSTGQNHNTVDLALGKRKREILEKLGDIDKISLFVETYLGQILTKQKTIDEAIEEVGNIEKRVEQWFLKELGENKEEGRIRSMDIRFMFSITEWSLLH